MQQALIERPVGLELTLPDGVLHQVVAQVVRIVLLALQRGVDHVLIRARRHISLLGQIDGTGLFGRDCFLYFIQASAGLLDQWVVRAIERCELGELGGTLGLLGSQRAQRSVGSDVVGEVGGVWIGCAENAVASFGHNALDASFAGRSSEVFKLGTDLALACVKAKHSQTLLHVHHLFLRRFDLLLQIIQLAGEPFGDALSGSKSRLKATLDVVVDDGVDDSCRELGAQAGVADLNNVCVRHQLDAEPAFELTNDLLTHSRLIKASMRDRASGLEKDRVILQV